MMTTATLDPPKALLSHSRSRPLQILVVVLVTIGSLLFRNHTLLTNPQMFSEDIFVYLNEDRLFGISAMFMPYNGYFQFCNKIIAYAVGFAPVRYAASLYSAFFVGSIFATAAVVFTSPAFRGWGKVIAALTIVCSPTNSEVFLGFAYEYWVLAPVVALALYENPSDVTRANILIGYFAMVAFSSPLVIIAAPFVVLKLISEQSRFAKILTTIAVASLIFQLQHIIHRSTTVPVAGTGIEKAFGALSILYAWATGPEYPGVAVALIVSVSTAAFWSWYFWANRKIAGNAFIYFIAYGAVVLVAGCLQVPVNLPANPFFYGARYFYLPTVWFVLAILAIEQKSRRGAITLPIIVITMSAIYISHVRSFSFHIANRNWLETADCIEKRDNCVTLLNPGGTGFVRIPSNSELLAMNAIERRQFLQTQRWN